MLNADEPDSHLSELVGEKLSGRKHGWSRPLRKGTAEELRRDLEQSLTACDGLYFAVLQPGSQPIRNLAQALRTCGVSPAGEADNSEALALLQADLRRGPQALQDLLPVYLPADKSLLLLIDQFEEVFRLRDKGDPDDADAFVSLLLQTAGKAAGSLPACSPAADGRVFVVLTMRSDYLGDCALFPGLPEAVSACQFLTPRLTRAERRQAIEGPAAVFDAHVKPDLVTRLLNDMGTDPDQLPLMQHLLHRLWTKAAGQPSGEEGVILQLEAYEEVGGITGALSQHADEVLRALDDRQQWIVEVLFTVLTDRTPLGRLIRRPDTLQTVADVAGLGWEAIQAVAEVFRHPDVNFLAPPPSTTLTPQTVLDITHESLIRQWGALRGWITKEAEAARVYRRLEQTAILFEIVDGMRTFSVCNRRAENSAQTVRLRPLVPLGRMDVLSIGVTKGRWLVTLAEVWFWNGKRLQFMKSANTGDFVFQARSSGQNFRPDRTRGRPWRSAIQPKPLTATTKSTVPS